jgi:hypothetical protein
MSLIRRLFRIAGKITRLLATQLLIRWFGVDGTACIASGLRSCQQVYSEIFSGGSGKVRV